MPDDSRRHTLNDKPVNKDGRYMLYWMQSSQRADDNAALHRAIREANRLDVSVLAVFGLTDDYPEANERHFAFMLEGLKETSQRLAARGVKLVGHLGAPADVAIRYSEDAVAVVTDAGYLSLLREWRDSLAAASPVRVEVVESDVIVPVGMASDKAEYAARTLRPKINRQRDACLSVSTSLKPATSSLPLNLTGDLDFSEPEEILQSLDVDRSVPRSDRFTGGISAARQKLANFLRSDLDEYAERRADPADPRTSELSPWLHFGQIGIAEVVQKVLEAGSASDEDKEAYIEELVVRRELAINHVWFTENYGTYQSLPDWARKTLAEHRDDRREHVYSRDQLEAGETHDPYWNAAMGEMLKTGYMHNMMRMYWGKKVLEWSNTPEYAYETLLYLNNRWFIDGRDANSYANVAWIFGLHDRGWTEREVYGKVRYMNDKGLERKFDIKRYVEWVDSL